MDIALETGSNETLARFKSYIDKGYFDYKQKSKGKFLPFEAATLKELASYKKFPFLVSPKYDGIRGILHSEYGLISRSSTPIANHHIRETLEGLGVGGLDGELLTLTNGKIDDFQIIQSKVNAEEGKPEFVYMVFDCFDCPSINYIDRMNAAKLKTITPYVKFTPFVTVHDLDFLCQVEKKWSAAYEGIMIRQLDAPYKHGRSSLKEGGLIKYKRFLDDEGSIMGMVELTNGEYGTGAFVVKWRGKIFNVGTGLSDNQRKEYWRIRHELIGKKKLTFKYQGLTNDGLPRFASFMRIRE